MAHQHTHSQLRRQSPVRFYLARLRERLWLKPFLSCLFSVFAVFIACLADGFEIAKALPDISPESLESILSIMSASMLVIAMFAVGAMISAYASASNTATPRALPLVVSDDVSQNALSTFIGAFIFSIVGLVAHLNGLYANAGRFVLFVITLCVFAIVVLSFVRWVDRIARLGRLGHTVDKVETAAHGALQSWARLPRMGASPQSGPHTGQALKTDSVGYVQNIDVAKLQQLAERLDATFDVLAPPGEFITPDRELVRVTRVSGSHETIDCADEVISAFVIGEDRTFVSDPRFGLVVMSEVASRALSPGINDPGSAIDIINSLTRLLIKWARARQASDIDHVEFDRVTMADLNATDLFIDAFKPLARDGAAYIEVGLGLQTSLYALAQTGEADINQAAHTLSDIALRYAEASLTLEEDLHNVRTLAQAISRINDERDG